jgi:ribulose-bisphosphate carboxylase large chain
MRIARTHAVPADSPPADAGAGVPGGERILATYRIRCAPDQAPARALALATEQSVEMPLQAVRDPWVREHVVARVESVEPEPTPPAAGATKVAGAAAPEGASAWIATIALSADTTGPEPGQLLNMLFGNSSLQPDVELLDAVLPNPVVDALPGPARGVEGLRELVGAHGRALTCTALKPQGLSPESLAELAGTFAGAGIDVIKDDHGIADQAYSPFERRVPAVQRAVDRANAATGRRSVYAPSLSGGPRQLAAQLRVAREAGVRCVLACPLVIGVPAFCELVRGDGGFAVLAHPALAGASRIAAPLLLGRLLRLFGADATIFPNFGGRFSYSRETCLAIARAAREPLGAHRAILPVPAGGMSVARVEEMLAEYGRDTMLLIGGNLLEAGDAMAQRAREFVERVERASRSPAAAGR